MHPKHGFLTLFLHPRYPKQSDSTVSVSLVDNEHQNSSSPNLGVSSSDLLSNHADMLVNLDFHCGLNDCVSSHSCAES